MSCQGMAPGYPLRLNTMHTVFSRRSYHPMHSYRPRRMNLRLMKSQNPPPWISRPSESPYPTPGISDKPPYPIDPVVPFMTSGNTHRMIRLADSSRAPNVRAKSEFSNLVSLTLYDVLAEKRIRSLKYFISVPGIVACTPVSISWMVKRREICSSLGYNAKGCHSAKHPVSYLHCHLTNGVVLINPSGMAV